MKNSIYILLLLLFGCNSKSTDTAKNKEVGWSQQDQLAFLNNCQDVAGQLSPDKAKKYCACLLDVVVEKHTDYEDAVDMEQDNWEDLILASNCHTKEFEDAIAVFWKERETEAFKSACKQAAIKRGDSEQQAEKFCSCAFDKVTELVPNPNYTSGLTDEEWAQILDACK